MPTRRRILGLLTTLMMAIVAVWCCCMPAAALAASPAKHSCCDVSDAPVDHNKPCPGSGVTGDDCPIVKLRSQMPTVSPILVATPIDLATPLADWFVPAPRVALPVVVDANEAALPATGPPTLLNLHTSLLW